MFNFVSDCNVTLYFSDGELGRKILVFRFTQCSHLLAESDLIIFRCGPNQNIGEKSAYKILLGNTLGETTNERNRL